MRFEYSLENWIAPKRIQTTQTINFQWFTWRYPYTLTSTSLALGLIIVVKPPCRIWVKTSHTPSNYGPQREKGQLRDFILGTIPHDKCPGSLFDKRTDVLMQDLVKPQNHEIMFYTFRTLKFDRHIVSAEVPPRCDPISRRRDFHRFGGKMVSALCEQMPWRVADDCLGVCRESHLLI